MRKIEILNDWHLKTSGYDGKVNLPNDYSISKPRSATAAGGGSNGFFVGGFGEYTKYIDTFEEGKHYILDIDGAYMCATVKLNEKVVAVHQHGYTPFLVDLTENVRCGKTNKLYISTNDLQPSTRWYSGAGLYRNICLWEGGEIRIEPRDTFIKTQKISEAEKTAFIDVSYVVSSDKNAHISLLTKVFGKDGKKVLSHSVDKNIVSGKNSFQIEFCIENSELWDTDNPNLYKLITTIEENGAVRDTEEISFGIRTISADSSNGLLLNGKPINLKGGCIHHDHGVLGSADYPQAVYRKLLKLKSVGFNAIRSAHNPPSSNLLEACDRLGMLLMDEIYDAWNVQKEPNDYHLFFALNWQKDIEEMVKRDRSHPCVISYSTGNEIPESAGFCDGVKWSQLLADEIRKYDDTRLVTVATWGMPLNFKAEDTPEYILECKNEIEANSDLWNDSWVKRTEKYFYPYDICGYNYLYEHYEEDHKVFPDRVIWGSETKVLTFYDSWKKVVDYPYVIGDFTWTAYDNIGEVGTGRFAWEDEGSVSSEELTLAEYPWRTCYQGDFDLCGFRRPQSYFRRAVWQENAELKIFTTHPKHYGKNFTGTGWHWYDVHEDWTFEDKYLGKPVLCEVYSVADEIKWYLNGEYVGFSVPQKAISRIEIPYKKGVLSAVAYKKGEICGEAVLRTTEEAYKILIKEDAISKEQCKGKLRFFEVFIADKEDNNVTTAQFKISCQVDNCRLLGIYSANPCNEDVYGSDECHTFDGRALAVVEVFDDNPKKIKIFANGLIAGELEFN